MNTDYPRMLFHRTKQPVTVRSRDEEEALGKGWSRRIWPPEPEPEPELEEPPEPEPELEEPPEPEPELEEEEVPPASRPPTKHPRLPAAAKTARKRSK